MGRLYHWETPVEQCSLLAEIQRGSGGFVPFRDRAANTITGSFGLTVAKHRDRLAVKGHRHSYTYAELDSASNAVAEAVLARSQGRRVTVALFLEHDAPVVACILGVLKAGSVYVPLDPNLTGTRNSVILHDALSTIVFTDSQNQDAAKALFGSSCLILDIDEVIASGREAPQHAGCAEDSACVSYTSGSTGRPRGVLHTHGTILQVAKRYVNAKGLGPNDRVTLLYSTSVAASLGNIFGPLLSGATLLPFNVRARGFSALAKWLVEEKITVYHSSPSVFRAAFESIPQRALLPNLRIVRVGGDMAYKSDFELFKRLAPADRTMVNAYGCSEISTVCCFYMTAQSVITEPILPVGCPIDGEVEVAILDEAGEPVEPGIVGEIAIRSAHISPGYWSSEQSKRQEEAGAGGVRLYRTGDLGKISRGCLFHQGRKDFQVKIRGYRIELAEVESTLRSHPMVKAAVVVSKKLTEWTTASSHMWSRIQNSI